MLYNPENIYVICGFVVIIFPILFVRFCFIRRIKSDIDFYKEILSSVESRVSRLEKRK